MWSFIASQIFLNFLQNLRRQKWLLIGGWWMPWEIEAMKDVGCLR